MSNEFIKFGTDGWRAIIADDFTVQNVRLVAQATAEYFLTLSPEPTAVIGYDTRFASATFAKATAEVFAANGVKTYLSREPVPTPVTSYGIVTRKATGGVVITASHNPGNWNGFKVKSSNGSSLEPENVAIIEKRIHELFPVEIKTIPATEAFAKGLLEYVSMFQEYADHIATLVDLEAIRKSDIKIAVDSMHGAGIGYLKRILNCGNKLAELHNDINPLFPDMNQPEPIDANLHSLSSFIKSEHYDVGLATDGDADRLGVMDENGNFMTQLEVCALLAYYLLEFRKERGPIVKSITTTEMLYGLGKLYKVQVEEVNVGFKYVAPVMIKTNAIMGCEESGGYGFCGHIPERDGILAGLYFIDLMLKTNMKPSEILKKVFDLVGPHYYNRIDVKFDASKKDAIIARLRDNRPEQILGVNVIDVKTDDGFKYYLEDGSWLLIRFSGTEPLLRTYTETNSPERVKAFLKECANMAGI
jgi:phosphomannomutase